MLQQADDLISLVQANIGKPVKLFVYNVDYDNVREVTLVPNDAWGGEGCLGCAIGYVNYNFVIIFKTLIFRVIFIAFQYLLIVHNLFNNNNNNKLFP